MQRCYPYFCHCRQGATQCSLSSVKEAALPFEEGVIQTLVGPCFAGRFGSFGSVLLVVGKAEWLLPLLLSLLPGLVIPVCGMKKVTASWPKSRWPFPSSVAPVYHKEGFKSFKFSKAFSMTHHVTVTPFNPSRQHKLFPFWREIDGRIRNVFDAALFYGQFKGLASLSTVEFLSSGFQASF